MGRIIEIIKKDFKTTPYNARTSRARRWLSTKINKNQNFFADKINFSDVSNPKRRKPVPEIGKMYMYKYDPKHKDTLPYYDIYPLVFPIEWYDDGFLGINLHYLDIPNRVKLLDDLDSLKNTKEYTEKTKLRISYALLGQTVRDKRFEPCIKRYLFNHVRSMFVEINADEWDIAIHLPVQRFQKKNERTVWRESRKTF